MPPELTGKAWAQIRSDYEHTERPVADICAEHGISSGTLRDRMHRWGWTRRRPPIPFEGPPPSPAPVLAPQPGLAAPAACQPNETAGPPGVAAPAEPDDRPIAERLQSAVARVLPAIEGTLATLGTGPAHPRELERTARALTALVRTLRELNGLLAQHAAAPPACDCDCDDMPEDIDEFRNELARRINALVDQRTGTSHSSES